MNECHRILVPGGIMQILVPSWKSERAYGDMSHEWPPVAPSFFWYVNKSWREANKLTHGPYAALTCDFEWSCGPTGLAPQFALRSYESQVFAATHYADAYGDMWATLKKRA